MEKVIYEGKSLEKLDKIRKTSSWVTGRDRYLYGGYWMKSEEVYHKKGVTLRFYNWYNDEDRKKQKDKRTRITAFGRKGDISKIEKDLINWEIKSQK